MKTVQADGKESDRQPKQTTSILKNNRRLYIYAEVDIDKAYLEITSKSKKIQRYLQTNKLDYQFLEKMRVYKNLRICFDNEIQKFIHTKQLTADLRLIKKNVFSSFQDFLIQRFKIYLEDEQLHAEYKQKINEVQSKFARRMEQLMKGVQQ